MEELKSKRLESLDVLRGFDLFCLVALEGIMHPLSHVVDASWMKQLMWWFTHVDWEGFSSWDLVMPLFMFMAGVSMPFAFSRYKKQKDRKKVYFRIVKRVVLLWLLGMICQGNLLGLDPQHIYLYSNTLQSIAMGYLIAAILFLNTCWKTQLGAAFLLMMIYWVGMNFFMSGNYGGGVYSPNANWAEYVDRMVLGRFRDAATVTQDGSVQFAPWYHYTWIWSSLNFGATVISGVLAGVLLKNEKCSKQRKAGYLFLIGLILVVFGWLLNLQYPVIKKLWTSSMVLVSSGYCYLLMAFFYYVIDCKGRRRYITWLKVYGMNSITAYVICCCVNFSSVSRSLLYGLQQYVNSYYPVVIAIANALIIYFILWILYRNRIFLRV